MTPMKITLCSPRRLARDVPVAVQLAALLALIPVRLLAATPFSGRGWVGFETNSSLPGMHGSECRSCPNKPAHSRGLSNRPVFEAAGDPLPHADVYASRQVGSVRLPAEARHTDVIYSGCWQSDTAIICQ